MIAAEIETSSIALAFSSPLSGRGGPLPLSESSRGSRFSGSKKKSTIAASMVRRAAAGGWKSEDDRQYPVHLHQILPR